MESPLGCNNCPLGRGKSQNVLFSSLPESLKVCRWQFLLVVGPCKLGGIWPRHLKRAKNPGVTCERKQTTIGPRTGINSNVSASVTGEKITTAGGGARDGTRVEAAAAAAARAGARAGAEARARARAGVSRARTGASLVPMAIALSHAAYPPLWPVSSEDQPSQSRVSVCVSMVQFVAG